MNGVYNAAKTDILSGEIDLATDPIQALLVSPSFVLNLSSTYVSEITGEVSGLGYARLTLTGKSVTTNNFLNISKFTADNPTWSYLSVGVIASIVLYKLITDDAHSPLIASYAITPNYLTNGNIFTIKWADDGIFTLSQT